MLYTSASTGLVQPQLKFGEWEAKTMQGYVQTKFANELHIQKGCYTPVTEEQDPGERSPTCLSIEHAAMGYKNYYNYLGCGPTEVAPPVSPVGRAAPLGLTTKRR
jgi:hypothetical protein